MEFLMMFVIFNIGFLVGFLFKTWLRFRSYDGVILITDEENKRIYSLELDDYPEKIAFKKEVVFKVETPEESPDRD